MAEFKDTLGRLSEDKSKLLAHIQALDVKISFTGGRRYTLDGGKTTVSMQQIISQLKKMEKEKSEPINSYVWRALQAKQDEGDQKLEQSKKESVITAICSSVRHCLGPTRLFGKTIPDLLSQYIRTAETEAKTKAAEEARKAAPAADSAAAAKEKEDLGDVTTPRLEVRETSYRTDEIQKWLFEGGTLSNAELPDSRFKTRNAGRYTPYLSCDSILMGEGTYSKRIGIINAGVTDLRVPAGQTAAVAVANNGDLFTGVGTTAIAVTHAAGPNLQRDLYNQFGVPVAGRPSEYGNKNYKDTEGRGYSISCDGHDMRKSHRIARVEFMTIPQTSIDGVRNAYREAFEHSKNLDYIIMPMIGIEENRGLSNTPELTARIAMEEFKKFVDNNPDSSLKVIFTIYDAHGVTLPKFYKEARAKLES